VRKNLPLQRTFNAADPDREVKQDIWDRFFQYYNWVKGSPFFISYSDASFRAQGIISPRQIIAWIKLISIIGEDTFNKIPLAINNNLEQENIFFLKEYARHFSDSNNLMITIACGFFWKFVTVSQRRQKMIAFYMNMVKNGDNIRIYTMDKTLKNEFTSYKPYVKHLPFRVDIHYTIIQPKNKKDRDNTLVFLELPHTEKTKHRLEAYFTIGQLREFGCSEKEIRKLLSFLKKQSIRLPHFLLKSLPSRLNLAFNWKRA
jgi:hypothetical protein